MGLAVLKGLFFLVSFSLQVLSWSFPPSSLLRCLFANIAVRKTVLSNSEHSHCAFRKPCGVFRKLLINCIAHLRANRPPPLPFPHLGLFRRSISLQASLSAASNWSYLPRAVLPFCPSGLRSALSPFLLVILWISFLLSLVLTTIRYPSFSIWGCVFSRVLVIFSLRVLHPTDYSKILLCAYGVDSALFPVPLLITEPFFSSLLFLQRSLVIGRVATKTPACTIWFPALTDSISR